MSVSVVVVADALFVMFVNVVAPEASTCHSTVGAGVPVAEALKLAVAPAFTTSETGCCVTAGLTGACVPASIAAIKSILPPGVVALFSVYVTVSVCLGAAAWNVSL